MNAFLARCRAILATVLLLAVFLLGVAGTADAQVAISACSWNVHRLGHGTGRGFDAIAAILESSCDVAMLQEVMVRQDHEIPAVEEIRRRLGDGWEIAYAEHPIAAGRRGGHHEAAVFAYRKTLAAPCDGWSGVILTAVVGFKRPPGFLCLELRDREGQTIGEVIFGDYHAMWDRGRRRSIEVEVALMPEVIAELRARDPRTTIVIGADTNLLASSRRRIRDRDGWRPETRFVETGTGTTLRGSGAITSNGYDAFIVDVPNEASVDAFPAARTHSSSAGNVPPARYVREVSDHLPVGVVLDLVDTTVATRLPDGVTCAGNTMALLTSNEHRSPTVARRAEARRSAREQVEARPAESTPAAGEGESRTPSASGATEALPGGSP